MKPQLKSSRAARDLIRTYEPFRPEAVRRGRRHVVGYGHTATAREGVRVSKEDAELLLIYDVLNAEQAVEQGVGEQLPGPVRDALVSFACSIGPGAFKVSDVARLAKAGRHREAANALETWVRAEEDGRLVVSERLTRRRAAEKALYLKGLQEAEAPARTAEPPRPAPAPEARKEAPATPVRETPRPQPTPPAPAREPRREAVQEAEPETDVPAGDGDTAPRIGPLIDLEIEFEDPPSQEELASVEPAAPRLEAGDADSALERALGPEPELETAQAVETAEPALERALGPAEAIKDEPAAGRAGEPASEAAPQTPAEPAPEPGPELALDKAEQDDVVKRVMARMARDISESMSVETAGEPVRLGYSFLEPVSGRVSIGAAEAAEPVLEAASGPADDIKDEPAAKAAEPAQPAKSAPVPVYASVAVGPVPVRAAPADATPPRLRGEPAEAPGYSGEVGGVGRPEEIEEIEAGEEEDLHPELVAGREARDLFREEEMETVTPAGGRWVYALNMGIGSLLAGYGIFDLVSRFDVYQIEPFFAEGVRQGPATLAGGLALIIASGWLLTASRKPRQQARERGGEDGVSGEV